MVISSCSASTVESEAGGYQVSEANLGNRVSKTLSQAKNDVLKRGSRALVWAAENTSLSTFVSTRKYQLTNVTSNLEGVSRKY